MHIHIFFLLNLNIFKLQYRLPEILIDFFFFGVSPCLKNEVQIPSCDVPGPSPASCLLMSHFCSLCALICTSAVGTLKTLFTKLPWKLTGF